MDGIGFHIEADFIIAVIDILSWPFAIKEANKTLNSGGIHCRDNRPVHMCETWSSISLQTVRIGRSQLSLLDGISVCIYCRVAALPKSGPLLRVDIRLNTTPV